MHRPAAIAVLLALGWWGCVCNRDNQSVSPGGTTGGRGGGGSGGGAPDAGVGIGAIVIAGVDAGNGALTAGVHGHDFTLDGSPGGLGVGLALDPDGGVILSRGSSAFTFMWIANDSYGWVSKYDTRTGAEVGRYWSVIPKDCSNSAGPPCSGGATLGLRADVSNHPSRTAVDLNGDVWVANRAWTLQGSVTKIANDVSGCIDRNGNGKIDTSRDVNGDGRISTRPADGEMIVPTDWTDPTQYDECVLFSSEVGPVGSDVAARAIAISAGAAGSAGDVWVGVFRDAKVYRLDSRNGQPKPFIPGGVNWLQLPFGPYGAIVDRQQRLWIVELGTARLALIDTRAGTLLGTITPPAGLCSSYAIGIDGQDRVWLPGWSLGAHACRYDHATTTWRSFDFSTARSQNGLSFEMGRGIAVDASGAVYMSGWGPSTAQLIRFDAETGTILSFNGAQFIDASDGDTFSSVGVGLDHDGQPWVANSSGNAMRVDKVTGAVLRTPRQEQGLYTYSDFTGYEVRTYTAPQGSYFLSFGGCGDNAATWHTLSWDADTPPNTSVQAYVRVAATAAELGSASLQRYGPFTASPVDLVAAGVPTGAFLRVELVLASTDLTSTPTLRSVDLVWSCN